MGQQIYASRYSHYVSPAAAMQTHGYLLSGFKLAQKIFMYSLRDDVYNAVCNAVGQKSKADHSEGIVNMYFAQANEYMEERTIAVAVACA